MIGVLLLVVFALAAACGVFALAYEEGEEAVVPVRDSFRITRAYGVGSECAPQRVLLRDMFEPVS